MARVNGVFLLMVLLVGSGVATASDSSKPTAYESAAEAAWQSVLNAEDKDRFRKQVEDAAAINEINNSIKEDKSERAKALLFQSQEIKRTTEDQVRKHFGLNEQKPESALNEMLKPGTTYIFVSQGMPEQVLVSLLAAYEDNEDHTIEIVFRGLEKDQTTIPSMLRAVGEIIRKNNIKPSVNIGLNPTVFNHFSITAVPTIVHILPDGSVANMRGSLNLDYFFSELKSKTEVEKGVIDLGVHGSLYDISERDLMEIIQERIAKIDWEKKKETAQQKYWQNYDYQRLPSAVEAATFYADMRVVVTEDIVVEGHLIAKKGDIVDPSAHLAAQGVSFNRRVIIFNPNSSLQTAWAREQVSEALALNEKPLVMLSEINHGYGGETLFKIEELMKVQIFLLVPEVVNRFGVNALPASVVQSERYPHAMLVRQWLCVDEKTGCRTALKPKWEEE